MATADRASSDGSQLAARFELDGQIDIERIGDPFQHRQSRHGAAGFEPGDRRQRRPSNLGELRLAY